MRKIALATSNAYADLTRDNRKLLNKLLYWGVDVEPIIWSSQDMAWNQYDAVFIRSCWDYHLRYAEFFKWIELLEGEGVTVFNAPGILRWNSNKRYLKELMEKGLNVVPSAWADGQSQTSLADLLSQNNWQQAIVKPCISANAYETWLTSGDAAQDENNFRAMLAKHSEILVQKFIPEVQKYGEWSFIFFDGEFSHAVIKKPSKGDFRVQESFGGTISGQRPPRDLINQAAQVIATLPNPGLYARVDGIQVGRTLFLIELEMLEPSLYLDQHPRGVDKFAESIVAHVNELAVTQGIRPILKSDSNSKKSAAAEPA